MATAAAMGRKAEKEAFKRASSSLAQNRFGPNKAQQRQYQDRATQAASQGLAPVAQQVAQSQMGGPQVPGAATPLQIAGQQAALRQQAVGATAEWRDKMAAQQQAQAMKTVQEENARRRAQRAAILGTVAGLALPAAGPVSGALKGLSAQAAEGSTKRNVLGGASQYLTNLQDMYDPSKRRQGTGAAE